MKRIFKRPLTVVWASITTIIVVFVLFQSENIVYAVVAGICSLISNILGYVEGLSND